MYCVFVWIFPVIILINQLLFLWTGSSFCFSDCNFKEVSKVLRGFPGHLKNKFSINFSFWISQSLCCFSSNFKSFSFEVLVHNTCHPWSIIFLAETVPLSMVTQYYALFYWCTWYTTIHVLVEWGASISDLCFIRALIGTYSASVLRSTIALFHGALTPGAYQCLCQLRGT